MDAVPPVPLDAGRAVRFFVLVRSGANFYYTAGGNASTSRGDGRVSVQGAGGEVPQPPITLANAYYL